MLLTIGFCRRHFRGSSWTSRHTLSKWWPRPSGYALGRGVSLDHRASEAMKNEVQTHSSWGYFSNQQIFSHHLNLDTCLSSITQNMKGIDICHPFLWLKLLFNYHGCTTIQTGPYDIDICTIKKKRAKRNSIHTTLSFQRVVWSCSASFCFLVKGPWSCSESNLK